MENITIIATLLNVNHLCYLGLWLILSNNYTLISRVWRRFTEVKNDGFNQNRVQSGKY
jgi:hypothetical protein